MDPSPAKVRVALRLAQDPDRLPVERMTAWRRLDRWARDSNLSLAPMLAAYGLPGDMPLQDRMAEAEALAAEAARVLHAWDKR